MSFAQGNGISTNKFELPMINFEPIQPNNVNIINQNDLSQNNKKSRREVYGQGIEAKIIKDEIGDFNVNESEAYQVIIKRFGRSIRFSELLGIINTIQLYIHHKYNIVLPQISRNEKRSFPLLIKYIDRNSDIIMPYIPFITLCDSNYKKIQLDTK